MIDRNIYIYVYIDRDEQASTYGCNVYTQGVESLRFDRRINRDDDI